MVLAAASLRFGFRVLQSSESLTPKLTPWSEARPLVHLPDAEPRCPRVTLTPCPTLPLWVGGDPPSAGVPLLRWVVGMLREVTSVKRPATGLTGNGHPINVTCRGLNRAGPKLTC